jgi:hypothetical protein
VSTSSCPSEATLHQQCAVTLAELVAELLRAATEQAHAAVREARALPAKESSDDLPH